MFSLSGNTFSTVYHLIVIYVYITSWRYLRDVLNLYVVSMICDELAVFEGE